MKHSRPVPHGALRLAVGVILAALVGSVGLTACSDGGPAPEVTLTPTVTTTTAPPFAADVCARTDLPRFGNEFALDEVALPQESIRSFSGGELFRCSATLRSATRSLAEASVSVLAERFDDGARSDARWAEAIRRADDPASALGAGDGPNERVLLTRPPRGDLDGGLAVAAVRTLTGYAERVERYDVRVWARRGATVLDLRIAYQAERTGSQSTTLDALQDEVDALLRRTP